MAKGDTFPYPVNHVAISVPDVQAAVQWYTSVMGFRLLKTPATVDRAVTPQAAIFKIFPEDLQKVTTAHMSAGNGVGVELFQFHDPAINEDTKADFARDYKRGGFFHIGVTTPDPNALCETVVAAGGKKIGETVPVYEYEALYVQDPWGNVVELISESFERIMSNRG